MANSIVGINDLIIAQGGFQAFIAATTPLNAFSTNFSAEAARKGDTIHVFRETYPDEVPLTKASHADYVIQDADSDAVPLVLGQPDYVSWGLDDVEIASSSALNIERYGNGKGNMLAKTVLGNIWGEITAANYTNDRVVAAVDFDYDDIVDLKTDLDALDAPKQGRSLVISSAYSAGVLKDLKANENAGSTPLREGSLGRLAGFDVYESELIPDNGENLAGFACVADCMAVAMRYLMPQEGNTYNIAMPMTDPQGSGMTIGLRDWYDNDSGVRKRVLETIYDKKTGIANGLVRLKSAV